MTLSILIPAYNAEGELSSCLDSILSQAVSAADVEVIVVDDGSVDATAKIMQSYTARHLNVRCVTQTNAGVSAARNHALRLAQGDYVTFVDADDEFNPHSLQQAMQHLGDATPDVIIYRSTCGDAERYPWGHIFTDGETYTPDDLLRRHYIRGSVCGVFFRRSLIATHRLQFLEGVVQGEDCQFGFEALAHAESVRFNAVQLYRVVKRPTSASRVFSQQRIALEIQGVKLIFEHTDHILRSVRHGVYIPYMRYMPVSCLVAHLLQTPGVGLRCFLASGLQAYCHQIHPASRMPFLKRKMQILRSSMALYYTLAYIKHTIQNFRH